jgi:hypothetical protein
MESFGSSAQNKSTRPKKWLPWVIVALCLLPGVLVTSYLYTSEAIKERHNRIQFDSEVWKRAKPDGVEGVRLRMVDDLIQARHLEGKSRDEVMGLLGESDGDPSFERRFPKWQMHYYLGPTRGSFLFSGMDYDYLVFRLDDKNRVVAMDIVTFTT